MSEKRQGEERIEEGEILDDYPEMGITIDGEVRIIAQIHRYGGLPLVETRGGWTYFVAENAEAAGEAAREYWEDLARNDKREFVCVVGEETLVDWALGNYAGPGSNKVPNLEAWLDLWLDTPEEHWARYDGRERTVTQVGRALEEELGFVPTVAYLENKG